ncbi:ets-related transcription factor elf-1 isoform x1 [Limosa lapponica baueri]|uniref:Ets-related transcription factor elf-1 isoform x1 n=1 Tax=Limosa lapponica baueri TaxID=1758121 RepID=A0A2I0TQB6_LIMLA|nr:ets-related transcription factor elf-1 isoform x1 [Limosa lapponica baueri]
MQPWIEVATKLGDPSIFPAVIVEHVPSADLLHNYSGLTCVDEPSDMITESSLDVAEEQIIEDDDITLTDGENGIDTVSWWLAIPAAQLIMVKSFIHQHRLRQSPAQSTNKIFLCSS